MSTDTSEGPDGRRKVWKGLKAASNPYLYRQLSPGTASDLKVLSAGLGPLYERLEAEIEFFSLLESRTRTRDCVLAAAPTGESLLRSRGLLLPVTRD